MISKLCIGQLININDACHINYCTIDDISPDSIYKVGWKYDMVYIIYDSTNGIFYYYLPLREWAGIQFKAEYKKFSVRLYWAGWTSWTQLM